MGNAARKVQDFVSDPSGDRLYAVDAATEIEIGDLLWLDGDDVKPVSHADVWTGSEDGSRGKVAEKFVGVAAAAHRANTDPAGTIRVHCRGQFRFPCTSSTFEVGDMIGVKKDTGGNYFLDQEVVKLSAVSAQYGQAIGFVTTREAIAVAAVNFEIAGKGVAGGGRNAFLTS